MSVDTRTLAIADVIGELRTALGLAPDRRADVTQAFCASDAELHRLRDALGDLIAAADKPRSRRKGRRGSSARGTGH